MFCKARDSLAEPPCTANCGFMDVRAVKIASTADTAPSINISLW